LAVGSNSIKTEIRIVRVLEKNPIQKQVVEKIYFLQQSVIFLFHVSKPILGFIEVAKQGL
jgi:hypothetical protein